MLEDGEESRNGRRCGNADKRLIDRSIDLLHSLSRTEDADDTDDTDDKAEKQSENIWRRPSALGLSRSRLSLKITRSLPQWSTVNRHVL